MVHLAFRQLGRWVTHHITGREVCLVPVTFDGDGWFCAGEKGTTPVEVETGLIGKHVVQGKLPAYTFANTSAGREWCFLRNPHSDNYKLDKDRFLLRGTAVTLDNTSDSPTFIALRQREMKGCVSCQAALPPQMAGNEQEAGITMYMDEEHRYDLAIRRTEAGTEVIKRVCIGDVHFIQQQILLETADQPGRVTLTVRLSNEAYTFEAAYGGRKWELGSNRTRYISTETAGGFTGVMIGLYAQCDGEEGNGFAEFTGFVCEYE